MSRSGVDAAGCYRCGENGHEVRRLMRAAFRAERAGKSVGDVRDQIHAVKEQQTACAAAGHMIEASKRGGAIKNGHAVPIR